MTPHTAASDDPVAVDDEDDDCVAAAVCAQGPHHCPGTQPLSSRRWAQKSDALCAPVSKCNPLQQRSRLAFAEHTKHLPPGSSCLWAAATACASSGNVCAPPRRRNTKFIVGCFGTSYDETARPPFNCLPTKSKCCNDAGTPTLSSAVDCTMFVVSDAQTSRVTVVPAKVFRKTCMLPTDGKSSEPAQHLQRNAHHKSDQEPKSLSKAPPSHPRSLLLLASESPKGWLAASGLSVADCYKKWKEHSAE